MAAVGHGYTGNQYERRRVILTLMNANILDVAKLVYLSGLGLPRSTVIRVHHVNVS